MLTEHEKNERLEPVRRWLAVAVAALLLAGCFSLGLIIGRMPPFSSWVTDPGFFRRVLVVHVDLALIVWFYAFIVGLIHLLGTSARVRRISNALALVSASGVAMMVAAAGVEKAAPIMSNYVPVIDHPVFLMGLVVFAVSVVAAIVVTAPWRGEHAEPLIELPEAVTPGLRAASAAVVAAAATFFCAWLTTPTTLEAGAYYEFVFWGGGHVLQVACVSAMVALWLYFATSVLGEPILKKRSAGLLFGALVAPHLFAPLLTINGTQTALYHAGSTRLMQFGIFPVVLVFAGIIAHRFWRAWRRGDLDLGDLINIKFVGLSASISLTLVGFVLGAMIRGSNTMIPAHYHAAIGAVTVSFMTIGLLLLEPLGYPLKNARLKKLVRWQPALFGFGQVVFAIGFGMAGTKGMARKAYGAEQQILGLVDWIGLATMGVGGLIAIAGGLLFLSAIVAAVAPRFVQSARNLIRPRPFADKEAT